MKKLFLPLLLLISSYAIGQQDVTFSVDMSESGESFTAVNVNGTFNGWCGACNEMTDMGNGIWEVTLPLAAGDYEYKFTVDGWNGQEALTPGTPCTVTAGAYTNRTLTVADAPVVQPTVCWNSCDACGVVADQDVTFSVDMSESGESFTTVNVNGTFNGWCGACNEMTDMGNGIWEVTLPLAAGSYEYKFTIDGWNGQENLTSGTPCTVTGGAYTNRTLTVAGAPIVQSTVCWNSCNACGFVEEPMDSVDVTITVNTANIETVAAEGIFVAGGADFGNPGDNPMTDNGDGTFTYVRRVAQGYTGNYTFTNGACPDYSCKESIVGQDCADGQFSDRLLANVMSDTTITTCFGSCTDDGTCPVVEPPSDITFSVDMSDYAGTFTVVNLNGTFNGWCGACNPMNDMGDGIWELTLPLENNISYDYKFTVDGWTGQEDLAALTDCVMTTDGFTNRFINVTETVAIPTVCWESCEACVVDGVNDLTFDNSFFSIQPSLAFDYTTLMFNTTNNDDKAVTVLNAIGQVVYSTTLAGDVATHRLDVNGFSNGLYFVQVQSGNTVGTHKMVVNK